MSTLAFGDPSDEYRISGASTGRDGNLRSSVVRILQKDVVVGGDTLRKQCSVSLQITTPTAGFTSAELDSLAEDISTFLTASSVTRLMQGES